MSEKYLTLLVVPHDERNVRRVRLSYRSLKIAAGVAAVFAVVALAAIATYGRVASRATRAALLERENAQLEEENRKVEQIAENLARTEQAYDQIRSMAGLPATEPRTGAGGRAAPRELRAAEPGPDPTGSEGDGATGSTTTGDPAPRARAPDPNRPSAWPLTIEGFVTAEYTGKSAHPGIDIAVPPRTPVVATADGTVRQAGFDPMYGHYVVVDHREDVATMYAHNELLLVEEGASVERGETIAYSGNSGRSTAPHLHYEVREAGWPVDPRPYLP